MRYAVLALVAVTACGRGSTPKFNELPTGAATAPAAAPSVPATGSSDLRLTGEVETRTTRDFQCSYAVDDFFVRGQFEEYQGVPLYLSINVEFYKKPGRYPRRTQVLVRRVARNSRFYASWTDAHATATVLPRGRGADVEVAVLAPEAGTDSTKPVTISGHVGCLAPPSPGPG